MRLVFKNILFFLLVVAVRPVSTACAQDIAYEKKNWETRLDANTKDKTAAIADIFSVLPGKDSVKIFSALDNMGKKAASKSRYLKVWFKLVEANSMWFLFKRAGKDRISGLLKPALQEAYEINDEDLAATISWNYGSLMYDAGDIEPAAMYCLNGAEICRKIEKKMDYVQYWLLGEILYHTNDYEKSIYYTKLSTRSESDTSFENRKMNLSPWNTVALCWQKMGVYDSAFFYYEKAMRIADSANSEVWKGIISGNMGQIYYGQGKYDIARPLLEYDYRTGKQYDEPGSAANSLQWVARINLLQGKKEIALEQVKEAMLLLKKKPEASYLKNLYYTTADVYRVMNNNDSFYKYSQLYTYLHDSIERSVANSRMEISRIKLENQESVFKIKNLQQEKQTKLLVRNYIIAGIILLAIIALLLMNRQRLRLQHKQQSVLQQKKAAEAETSAALEQLQLYTQTLIEKTSLIEKLQEQLQNRQLTIGQQQLADELSSQTILTEDDWSKFRSLFERIYPGFFVILKQTAPDITTAEQRMAALTRLHLTTRQMASMLGISVESVNKTRQRLRTRLKLPGESNLGEYIANL